jgi:hypothetical protein
MSALDGVSRSQFLLPLSQQDNEAIDTAFKEALENDSKGYFIREATVCRICDPHDECAKLDYTILVASLIAIGVIIYLAAIQKFLNPEKPAGTIIMLSLLGIGILRGSYLLYKKYHKELGMNWLRIAFALEATYYKHQTDESLRPNRTLNATIRPGEGINAGHYYFVTYPLVKAREHFHSVFDRNLDDALDLPALMGRARALALQINEPSFPILLV